MKKKLSASAIFSTLSFVQRIPICTNLNLWVYLFQAINPILLPFILIRPVFKGIWSIPKGCPRKHFKFIYVSKPRGGCEILCWLLIQPNHRFQIATKKREVTQFIRVKWRVDLIHWSLSLFLRYLRCCSLAGGYLCDGWVLSYTD